MSDLKATLGPDRVEIDLDEGAFPRDAVYAAAYTFIDRCYVRLDRAEGGRLGVVLRAKSAGSLDGEALAAELRNELLGQAWRQQLIEDGRELTASLAAGAFGAPGYDPLGIALTWEEKQAPQPIAVTPAHSETPKPPVASEGEQGT